MLSRLLATARLVVPSSQSVRPRPTSRTTRPPSSSERWTRITRRMYAASRAPRLASTRSRIASSSRPSSSTCSEVRWAAGPAADRHGDIGRQGHPAGWSARIGSPEPVGTSDDSGPEGVAGEVAGSCVADSAGRRRRRRGSRCRRGCGVGSASASARGGRRRLRCLGRRPDRERLGDRALGEGAVDEPPAVDRALRRLRAGRPRRRRRREPRARSPTGRRWSPVARGSPSPTGSGRRSRSAA